MSKILQSEKLERLRLTLTDWIQAANARQWGPPIVEPVQGDGDFHALHKVGCKSSGGRDQLTILYGQDPDDLFGIDFLAEDARSIRFMPDCITFKMDGEPGCIYRTPGHVPLHYY